MGAAVIAAKIAAVIASLDRICTACLCANSEATWHMLHRGRSCRLYDGIENAKREHEARR